jgi:hypothetical protein
MYWRPRGRATGKPAPTLSLIHDFFHPRNVPIGGTHAAVINFDDASKAPARPRCFARGV